MENWSQVTIGNTQGLYILTILSSSLAIVGSLYGFFRRMRKFFIARFEKVDARFEKSDARFKKMDARFELLENRIFHLAIGKSLKEIMLEEKNEKKL